MTPSVQVRVRCVLRVESGELPGLTTTWTFGEAHLERGRLAFTRRWPNSGVVTVDVTGIDASGEDVSPRISSGVAPELTVWRLSTATGVLGWRVDQPLGKLWLIHPARPQIGMRVRSGRRPTYLPICACRV